MVRVLFICHDRSFLTSWFSLFYAAFEKIEVYFTIGLQLMKDVPV